MNNIPKDKSISLSSWNYGAFSLTNPYYNIYPIKVFRNQFSNVGHDKIIKNNNEKIVKNVYFENMEYMNYISRDSDKTKRPKSSKNNFTKDNLEYRKTFTEWRREKNKKIREEKSKNKKEGINRIIDNNENRITFKMWKNNKIKEIKKNKEKKEKEEKAKNDRKNEEDNIRRENMNKWYEDKKNLQKSEKKKREIKNKKLKEENEKKAKIKEEKCKKKFKEWIIKKNKVKKENKKNKSSEAEKNNNKYIKRKYSQVIGPYSYAKDLRQMQKIYNEKNNKYKDIKRSNTSKK